MKFLAGSLHNFFLYLTKKMLAMILMLQLIASHYTVQCTTNDSLLPLICGYNATKIFNQP